MRLHLARGEREICSEKVAQRLETLSESDAHAAPILALRVEVELACGHGDAAREGVAALAAAAERLGREDLATVGAVYAA